MRVHKRIDSFTMMTHTNHFYLNHEKDDLYVYKGQYKQEDFDYGVVTIIELIQSKTEEHYYLKVIDKNLGFRMSEVLGPTLLSEPAYEIQLYRRRDK